MYSELGYWNRTVITFRSFLKLQQLCNAKLNEVDACSVAYALFELSKYVDI